MKMSIEFSLPVESALAGTDLDLHTVAPEVYSDLRAALSTGC
jgi:hypothetical protein